MKKIDEASREVNDGIIQFEQTLRSNGINPKVQKEEAERAVSQTLSNSPLKASAKGQRFSSVNKISQTFNSQTGLNGAFNQTLNSNYMTKTGGITL